ncbi:NAD(P)H-dependent flavin oxidoreductase [Falsibacillus albus]|uniref:Probable nitronate monooxygenase n=1 Tax=Falsibacillus albus TaxID=2478915 RepID=A0A3L7K302_9BACI|nr:nitronate monooxygenase [Falsibacillus albus]RLQ97413.1 nitronate monooxygenase [Falsibacillus albus]
MNELTNILGISYPVIQGGMGNISNAQLTAAVSNAGGLGTIGAGTMTPEKVEELIIRTKELTTHPFAVNIPMMVNAHVKEMVSLILKHRVPVVSLSAGNPAPLIPIFHEFGVKVMTVVGTVKHAVKAADAGSDIIVAEGYEAAGINSPNESTTMTLIPQVVAAINKPVAAAGGIGDGRGLLAVCALGAQGVQMGTRFIATQDAPFSDEYKKRVLGADDTSTMIIGRSVGKIRRVLAGSYAKNLRELENQNISVEEFNKATDEDFHCAGALNGDEENGFMNSGQIAGLIHSLPTVQELIEGMMTEYNLQLNKLLPIKESESL